MLLRYFNADTVNSLHFVLFESHMTYGCTAWGLADKSELDTLHRLQNRALRIITFYDYTEPTYQLFSYLGGVKLSDSIHLNFLLFLTDWLNVKLRQVFDAHEHELCQKHMLCHFHKAWSSTDTFGSKILEFQGSILQNKPCDLLINPQVEKQFSRK